MIEFILLVIMTIIGWIFFSFGYFTTSIIFFIFVIIAGIYVIVNNL